MGVGFTGWGRGAMVGLASIHHRRQLVSATVRVVLGCSRYPEDGPLRLRHFPLSVRISSILRDRKPSRWRNLRTLEYRLEYENSVECSEYATVSLARRIIC